MRRVSLLSLILPLSVAAAPLASLRDARRVVVVFAPDGRSTALNREDRLLAGDPAGLADRDISVVHVVGDRVVGVADTAAALRDRLGVARGAFAVRLIGKDGHVAIRSDVPIDRAQLFGAIDAMPMRQAERAHRRN